MTIRGAAGGGHAGKGAGASGQSGQSASGKGGKAGKGGAGAEGGSTPAGGGENTSGGAGESGSGGVVTPGSGGTAGEAAGRGGSSTSSGGFGGITSDAGNAGTPSDAGSGDSSGQTAGAGEGNAGAAPAPCPNGTDADGDGYGVGCELGPDCNDFEPGIHPGAPEICGNVFDDDCNPDTSDSCAVTCPAGGCGPGCSDGTREGFMDGTTYPNIAGCSGGFSVPGLLHATTATCNYVAGNSSANPNGDGCSAADLCAPGWHVCRHPGEVTAHSPDGCAGSHDATSAFFAARQSGSGCATCAVSTDATQICTALDCNTNCYPTDLMTNDVFGCGTIGAATDVSCGPLDRFGNNACGSLPAPWDCSASDGLERSIARPQVRAGCRRRALLLGLTTRRQVVRSVRTT